MKVRPLREEDAVLMLEWMHDDSVVHDLYTDFSKKTMEDCQQFIRNSQEDSENVNLAIADEKDIYMGTVSLKHIDRKLKCAEFGITVRKAAMGKGYAIDAMREIFQKAKEEFQLEKIYWCVSQKNLRAVKFYNKHCFAICKEVPTDFLKNYSEEIKRDLIWYEYKLK